MELSEKEIHTILCTYNQFIRHGSLTEDEVRVVRLLLGAQREFHQYLNLKTLLKWW